MEIEVSGRSFLTHAPELATLSLQLGFEAEDKAEVLPQTTALVRRVQAAIDELEARDPAPTTRSTVQAITTRSWRPFNHEGKVMPKLYSATSRVAITFCDFAALSSFIDQSGAEAGVTIGDVDWALTDETRQRLEAEALTLAVGDARHRAEAIAQAAGATGVDFSRVADPEHGGYPSPAAHRMSFSAAEDEDEGIDLSPEDIKVHAEIRATFVTR